MKKRLTLAERQRKESMELEKKLRVQGRKRTSKSKSSGTHSSYCSRDTSKSRSVEEFPPNDKPSQILVSTTVAARTQ